jgi:hypothetical protein
MGRGRAAGGGCTIGLGPAAPRFSHAACVLCCSWGRRGGKREEKEKEGKEKKKNMENFPNMKIFGEKNKK